MSRIRSSSRRMLVMRESGWLAWWKRWIALMGCLSWMDTIMMWNNNHKLSRNLWAEAKSQQLVILAGPHYTGTTSMEQFFYQYGKEHIARTEDGEIHPDRTNTYGLKFWLWPWIDALVANETEPTEPYKIFGHLVTDPANDLLRNEILEGIRMAWEASTTQNEKVVSLDGVILGSEWFDQVGVDAQYDALTAVQRIVKFIEVPPEDVTIVINYRAPRLDHWLSTWSHEYATSKEKYNDWLCDPNGIRSHIRALGTYMDPFRLVQVYSKEGYKVRVLDMEGIELAGRDISHVVACDVITGMCVDGQLKNHATDKPHINQVEPPPVDFLALTAKQKEDVERLFRYRDCAYQHYLHSHPKVEFYFNHSIWADCDPSMRSTVYKQLQDETSILYRALLSQVKCSGNKKGGGGMPVQSKDVITMDQALSGNIPKSVLQFQIPLQPFKSKAATTTKSTTKTTASLPERSGLALLLELVIFVFCLVAVFAYQYYRMTNSILMDTFRNNNGTIAYGKLLSTRARTGRGISSIGGGSTSPLSSVDAEYGDVIHDD